jgi:prophage tail gpP-like protein
MNVGVDRIAADLASHFGIGTYVPEPGAPFAAFSVQSSESCYDTIARAASKRGLVVYSVGGDLVLARAGQYRTRTVLERGDNLVRSSRRSSWLNRYSQYVFVGQARPDEDTWGERTQQLKHIVTDPEITRFRPLRVTAEAGSGLDLEGRANFERNQRAGSGQSVSCTVWGHLTEEGLAWRPNTLVHFRNPVLGVDATLLIVTCRFRFGANEDDSTDLELTRPEAWDMGKYPALGRGETWK